MKVSWPLRHDRQCRRLVLQLLHHVTQRRMNRDRVRAAILFADNAHLGQLRKSGEAFIAHPLLVALLVIQLGGQEEDVVAALLHDTVEDNPHVTLSSLFLAWGRPVVQRVEALTKNYHYPPKQRLFDAHGRLLQAVAELGPGVGVIKLADRAHNSATSSGLPEPKQQQILRENQFFFAPLAYQIGATGLARFLGSAPQLWWPAADDFVASMCALQAPLSY